ncbi:MAG: glycoside hydrolase family 26 protein [Treponema sp.]|nr:glycoside hydrolase family 26 protein [Treponema sp.]
MGKDKIKFSFLLAAVTCLLLTGACADSPPELPPVGTENISVMDFFNKISGKYTVLGIHNREPNSQPAMQTDEIKKRTGKYPGLWSGDFLFSGQDVDNRWTMIQECKRQWDNGAIVHLMLHVVSPKNSGEKGVWEGATGVCSELSSAEWTDLVTDGGTLNTRWKARLDIYTEYFQFLKDNGVTVLFRPFHEMNHSAFWWTGRPGQNGTAALYRLTRDYMEKAKGLDNIVWVWNMQDLSYNWDQYNPGADYWDIFSLDVYNWDGFTTYKYQKAMEAAGNKPIAIGETQVLPSPRVLSAQPRWVFCMSWAELTFEHNSDQQIRELYFADNTLERDKLPPFIGPASVTGNYVLNGNFSSTAAAWPNLPEGWDTEWTGGDGSSPVKTEDGRFIGWAKNAYSFTLSQTITGLAEGTYSLSADFRLNPDSAAEDIVMNAYSGETLLKSASVRAGLFAAPRQTDVRFSLAGIPVTDAEARIEFAGNNILNYIGIDNVSFF